MPSVKQNLRACWYAEMTSKGHDMNRMRNSKSRCNNCGLLFQYYGTVEALPGCVGNRRSHTVSTRIPHQRNRRL